MTLSITTIWHYVGYLNAERRDLFSVMLSVILLNVVMLNVIILNVIMLSVIMLNVIMLSVKAPH